MNAPKNRRTTNRSRRGGGFTLIEMLIVVVVLGILAAIVLPKLNVTKIRAFRSALLTDLRALGSVQEIYHGKWFRYSTNLTSLEAQVSEGVTVSVNEATNSGWAATATHSGVPVGQCGIYMGSAAPSGGAPATTPGVPLCDF